MNKPKFEARGKKQNRGQGTTPDQELKDVLSETAPPISEGLGISPEALNTEGFSTPEHQADMGLTATAPFVGMDREWTAEEKAGMNDSLRKYGWKDETPPAIEEANLESPALAASAAEVKDTTIINAAPGFKLGGQPFVPLGEPADRYQGPGEDGHADVSSVSPVDDVVTRLRALPREGATPKSISDAVLGNETPADGVALVRESDAEVLRILEAAHEAITKGWATDMRSFMRELLMKLDSVPVTGKPGEFDESWVSNQAYFPKNLILFVVRTPKVPIPGIPGDMLKRVLELYPISITGLKRSFKTKDRDMARTQQRFEAVPSVVRMEFGEKFGRVIGKMFETMARRVCEIAVNDNTTVDFMLVEPDPTHTLVLDAWLCSDMWPSEVENIDGELDITSAKDPAHVDVTWSGHVERSIKIDEQAQELLTQINVASSNPYTSAEFVNALAKSLEAQ